MLAEASMLAPLEAKLPPSRKTALSQGGISSISDGDFDVVGLTALHLGSGSQHHSESIQLDRRGVVVLSLSM